MNFFQADIAALGNLQRACQDTFVSQENLRHLGIALHEKLIAMKLQPVGVVDRLAGLDADHHVLRVGVVLAQIVAVVGRHQRQTKVLFQLQQIGLNALLFGNPWSWISR